MATQALVEQHVIFIAADTTLNIEAILANPLVQALATNSVGNDLIISQDHFRNLTGGVWTDHPFLEIKCYILPTFQATVQANIPGLAQAFPTFSIATWGYNVTWGN